MELESLNNQYLALKQYLKKSREKEQTLRKELEHLEQDKAVCESGMVVAKRDGDKFTYDSLKVQLDNINKQLANVKKDAQREKEAVQLFEKGIKSKLEQVQTNPELSLSVDKSLALNYQRQIKKLSQEKNNLMTGKKIVDSLIFLLQQDPSVMNYARGIVAAGMEIRENEKKLESLVVKDPKSGKPKKPIQYNDPTEADRLKKEIEKSRGKLETNKKSLKSHIKKRNFAIPESAIDELAKLECERKGKQLNVKAALESKQKFYTAELKKNSTKLEKYNIAYENLPDDAKPAPSQPQPQPQSNNIFKRGWNWISNTKFGKWVGRVWKGHKALPEPTVQPRVESNEFKDSLKYDIVRAARKDLEHQDLERAQQTIDKGKGGRS